MVVVACSGFPIAVSRYLQQFMAVEIADTEKGIPGLGTLRRWQRESPDGFVFTAIAPAEIGASGFSSSAANKEILKGIRGFAEKLGAIALVFRVPEDVAFTRTMPDRAKKLLGPAVREGVRAVIEAPGWKPGQVAKVAEALGGTPAVDPLHSKVPEGEFVYFTLPGPAGHRSRYDDDSMAQIAEHCQKSEAETTVCVFRNIDMEANATTLSQLLAAE